MKDARTAIVGATSGIGLALARALSGQGAQVLSFSRAPQFPEALAGIRHLAFDATTAEFPADKLPEALEGLVYCPGSIRLRPFNRLTLDDRPNPPRRRRAGEGVDVQIGNKEGSRFTVHGLRFRMMP